MSAIDMEPDTPQARIAARPPFTSVLRAVVSHRGVQAVAILWLAGTATALWLARGSLPFDRPAVAGLPFVPYLWFRRRYSNAELNLRSTNRRNDTLLILVVLAIESAFELSALDSSVLGLNSRQALLGAPLAFAVFFIGTVLPTMVLIYAILLPRYLKLTKSAISATLLGGLTYAAMHIVEGWSSFDTSLVVRAFRIT